MKFWKRSQGAEEPSRVRNEFDLAEWNRQKKLPKQTAKEEAKRRESVEMFDSVIEGEELDC